MVIRYIDFVYYSRDYDLFCVANAVMCHEIEKKAIKVSNTGG